MSIKLNLKVYNPAFPGGPEPVGFSLSALHGRFTDKHRQQLYVWGFERIDQPEYSREVWMLGSSIGPRNLYLVPLLTELFPDIRLDPAIVEAMNDVERHPADRERHPSVGQKVQRITAFDTRMGRAPLSVRGTKTVGFVVNCDLSHKERMEFLEAAGFRRYRGQDGRVFAALGTAPSFTKDVFLAANLISYFAESATRLMAAESKVAIDRMTRSRSKDFPEGFEVPAPEGFGYLDFQAAGIHDLSQNRRSCLVADEMGLGKTVTAIGMINSRQGPTYDQERVLIVCEANMRGTWVEELNTWLTSEKTIEVATGNYFPNSQIVIINYDIVGKHAAALRAVSWGLQIYDEAHRLKSPDAQRTKVLLGNVVADHWDEDPGPLPLTEGGQRLFLTGTPHPNRVMEMFPLLSSVDPDRWGRGQEAYQAMEDRYAPPFLTKKGGKILRLPGKSHVRSEEFQRRVRSGAMLRRLKRDVDLPPKMRQPLFLFQDMDEQTRTEVQSVLRQAEADILKLQQDLKDQGVLEGDVREAGPIIEIVDHYPESSEVFQTIARIRRNLGVLKAKAAADFMIEEMQADDKDKISPPTKTIIFAHHKEVIDQVIARLRSVYPDGVVVFDGRTGQSDREDARKRFQSDDAVRFFVGSSAAHTGLTLVRSNRVRFVELDWSPSAMVQAEDRAWRIGQEKTVKIGYFLIQGTLDSKIGSALLRKMKAIENNINTIQSYQDKVKQAEQPEKIWDEGDEAASAQSLGPLDQGGVSPDETVADPPAQPDPAPDTVEQQSSSDKTPQDMQSDIDKAPVAPVTSAPEAPTVEPDMVKAPETVAQEDVASVPEASGSKTCASASHVKTKPFFTKPDPEPAAVAKPVEGEIKCAAPSGFPEPDFFEAREVPVETPPAPQTAAVAQDAPREVDADALKLLDDVMASVSTDTPSPSVEVEPQMPAAQGETVEQDTQVEVVHSEGARDEAVEPEQAVVASETDANPESISGDEDVTEQAEYSSVSATPEEIVSEPAIDPDYDAKEDHPSDEGKAALEQKAAEETVKAAPEPTPSSLTKEHHMSEAPPKKVRAKSQAQEKKASKAKEKTPEPVQMSLF